jgi:shikimate kinase
MNASTSSPIALIGLMGAGKSEVARRLAVRLGGAAIDLDARIEAESGRSISEWFEQGGEPAFRVREREALERALDGAPAVIACGGGIVLDEAARALLATRCRAVWLEVSPAEAARRLAGAEAARPLLAGRDRRAQLERLQEARAALYLGTARWRVTTDGRSAEQVADAVLAALAGAAHS